MSIPLVGLGTWEIRGELCLKVVQEALEWGYRHIDTAHLYENHKEIGQVLQGWPRHEIFLTSKFLISQLDGSSVQELYERALDELQTDYLDLFLLHYPDRNAPLRKILEELEALKERTNVRATGVSNFTIRHLQDMLSWGLHPAVNQVEFHPFLYQKELLSFCQKEKILLVSFRTFGKGALVKEPQLLPIAAKYHKTPAQILLRWCIDKGVPVIPKASTTIHLKENLHLDFTLTPADTHFLDTLPTIHRYCQTKWADFNYV